MGTRKLEVAMTDQDYEALKKKLLETYSVRPTLLNPTVKRRVDWHCLKSSCFLDNTVFDTREKWMRHHQRFHNRMCGSDRGYPKENEAKQFIQEHDLRENARLGIAGTGGSAGRLMPPTATPAGPYSRTSGALNAIPLNSAAPSSSTSGALRAIPLNSAAPSSSTSGALRGASPNSAAPNSPYSPRSGALRNSVAARRRGPYRLPANKAAPGQELPDQGFVNIAGAPQDKAESSRTLDAARREILMQQLSYNLQAVSQINTDCVHILQILGLPSTNCVSEIRRPAGSKRPTESRNAQAQEYPATTVATPVPLPTWVDRRALVSTSRGATGLQAGQSKFVDPAHSNEGSAHVFETPRHVFQVTPFLRQTPAHSNEGPANAFVATPFPSQALALSIGGPAHSYDVPPHPNEAPALSIEGPTHLALTYMTPSQPEEEEEEENYNATSDSEEVDSDNKDQTTDVSQDVDEDQVGWMDVKVQRHAAGSWP